MIILFSISGAIKGIISGEHIKVYFSTFLHSLNEYLLEVCTTPDTVLETKT